MRPSTRSAGKPKTPMRSDERMTRLVTLSRASPRKPLTSPAAAQRGARRSVGGDVGGGTAGEECSRLASDALGERRAPRELAAVLRDLLVVALHQTARMRTEPQPGAVRAALPRVIVVQHRLDTRVLTLGVRVEEHEQPTLHLVVGAAGKHARIVAGGATRAPPARPSAPSASAAPAALPAGGANAPEEQPDQHSLNPHERHFLQPSS